MENQFYVHLSSADSKSYFSENLPSRFTTKLPEVLFLEGHWQVALCSISTPKLKRKTDRTLICSDLCGESIIGQRRLPLLRVVTGRIPSSFKHLYYIPVRLNEIDRITVYIRTEKLDEVSFADGILTCTLHFKKSK